MCFDHPEATHDGIVHPEDVLRGYAVGPNADRAFCTGCHAELRSGMACTVYAYRVAGAALWDVPRLYCERCAPDLIQTPTLGAIEVLADARLATQSRPDTQTHRLCLVEPAVRAYSDPDSGTAP